MPPPLANIINLNFTIMIKGKETIYGADGIVAQRVYTLQQVINAQAAGFGIVDEDGEDFMYWIEDENGERESNDKETFDRIAEAMQKGTPIYASFYLDCGKVVKEAATTLQSEYYVGQDVYYLIGNRLAKGTIKTIQIAERLKNRIRETNIRIRLDNGQVRMENEIGKTIEELFDNARKEYER